MGTGGVPTPTPRLQFLAQSEATQWFKLQLLATARVMEPTGAWIQLGSPQDPGWGGVGGRHVAGRLYSPPPPTDAAASCHLAREAGQGWGEGLLQQSPGRHGNAPSLLASVSVVCFHAPTSQGKHQLCSLPC